MFKTPRLKKTTPFVKKGKFTLFFVKTKGVFHKETKG